MEKYNQIIDKINEDCDYVIESLKKLGVTCPRNIKAILGFDCIKFFIDDEKSPALHFLFDKEKSDMELVGVDGIISVQGIEASMITFAAALIEKDTQLREIFQQRINSIFEGGKLKHPDFDLKK
jgi:hypothetical protein